MGQITHVAVRLGEIRQRDFRRMLVVSLVAHLAVFVVLTFRPPSSVISLPGVVSVELVAAPPGPARCRAQKQKGPRETQRLSSIPARLASEPYSGLRLFLRPLPARNTGMRRAGTCMT